jgi:hypothetical protein
MNIRNKTANVTKRPMIFGADQESVVPPHCKARIRQTIDGTKRKTPRGSRLLNWASAVNFSCFGDGISRKKKIARIAKAPIGKLT